MKIGGNSTMERTGGISWKISILFLIYGFAMPNGAISAPAQSYPTKGIQLVVPFQPGGASDLTGRLVATYLSEKWKRTISVVNKPGAGGITGVTFALQSKNDGYTLFVHSTGPATLNPAIESKLPYKWDDPTFIARTNISPLVFVVKEDAPWKSLKEIMEAVKKDPVAFKYGTSSPGGPSTFAVAQILEASGIDPLKVSRIVLQGGSPTVIAVAGGHVDFAVQYLSEVLSLVQARKVRGLAVTTSERTKQLPDVPTSREAGFEAFNLVAWNGICGPARLPASVVRKWDEAIREAVKDPAFAAKMEEIGSPPSYLGPKEFKAALDKEFKSALKFAEKLGFRK
jgi:tripartite-type tricarboxylate transporter receptor subunit TctC